MTRSHRVVKGLFPRVPLARLLALFFLVHPGSSATFESRHYLTQRYPNRDVIPPRSLLTSQRRRRYDTTTSPLSFIRPPVLAIPARGDKDQAILSSAVALKVIIGSFVSELETCNHERRRIGGPRPRSPDQRSSHAHPQQLQSNSQGLDHHKQRLVSSLPSSLASVQGGASVSSPSPVGKLFQKSAATLVDAYDGVLSFVGSRIVTTEASFNKALLAVSSSLATPLSQMEGRTAGFTSLMSRNGDAHMGMRPSSIETSSEAARGRHDNYLSVAGMGGSGEALSTSFSSPALVGFMDVDPFEKSKKHFKRNTSLAKLLL